MEGVERARSDGLLRRLGDLIRDADDPSYKALEKFCARVSTGSGSGMSASSIHAKMTGRTPFRWQQVVTLVKAIERYAAENGHPLAYPISLEALKNEWDAGLHGDSEGPSAVRHLKLDCVIVPSARPAHNLETAGAIARDAGATLLVLSSAESNAEEVAELLQRISVADFAIVPFSMGRLRDLKLETRRESTSSPITPTPDLSSKKNLGLAAARMCGWKRVLIMDDDISLDSGSVTTELAALESYPAVVFEVGGYPDRSVIQQTQRLIQGLPRDRRYGLATERDHSGASNILVDPRLPDIPFFADIYNEDWLFITSMMEKNRVAIADGVAIQRAYDPFKIPQRPAEQEFGELFVWGLQALLAIRSDLDSGGHSKDFWNTRLVERKGYLAELASESRRVVENHHMQNLYWMAIATAEARCKKITAQSLVRYYSQWRSDQQRWSGFLESLPRVGHISDSLKYFLVEAITPSTSRPRERFLSGPNLFRYSSNVSRRLMAPKREVPAVERDGR